MENKAYMYVLECGDGSLYTGYTTDVQARLKKNQAGQIRLVILKQLGRAAVEAGFSREDMAALLQSI